MLRGLGVTLLCLVAIAKPADASDRKHAVDRGVLAAPERTTTVAIAGSTRERAGLAQVAAVLWNAAPAARSGSAGGLRRASVNQPSRSASLLPHQGEHQGSVGFPWLRQARSGLALALTERFRVGLGYRHLEGEDLWPEFVDTGAAGYDSHHVLVRASWRF